MESILKSHNVSSADIWRNSKNPFITLRFQDFEKCQKSLKNEGLPIGNPIINIWYWHTAFARCEAPSSYKITIYNYKIWWAVPKKWIKT